MSADRELMVLAANAAGYLPAAITDDGVVFLRGVHVRWNPLTDDGDELRLARALGITIDYADCCAWKRMPGGALIQEFWGGDCGDEARAVLTVAAEIARATTGANHG